MALTQNVRTILYEAQPGDTLRFELEMKSFRRGVARISGRAYVGQDAVCEAELMAAVMPRERSG